MENIAEKIQKVITKLFDVEMAVDVTETPADQGGDFSTNVAMKLMGVLKKRAADAGAGANPATKQDDAETDAGTGSPSADFSVKTPMEIAEKIADALRADENFLFDVEVAKPGFLNFISRDEYWQQIVTSLSEENAQNFEKNISPDEYLGKTVICEFSDPNPFKVLHVGHLYTSIVGDSISRLIECAGGKVVRANFGGDVGLHVAKTMYALKNQDLSHASDIDFIAKCYVEGTRAYEDNETAHAEITQLNKEIYEIAAAGENAKWDGEKAEIAERYWAGRTASYAYFEDFYKQVGVKFDKYYPESTVAGRGLSEVENHVGDVYEKSNGAVIFPGEKYDLHTRVFINAEGLPTYEAKDVGLIFSKWDDYKFDKSVIITGNDIIDYMKVVLKSISLFAPELSERTEHITHGNVRLPGNQKMASRKGNFLKAVDVLNEVSGLIANDSQDEKTAAMITLAAIKYAFLKYKIGGNIEFNAKESVSTTGNSGVYLQYSAVRAKKILEKTAANGGSEKATRDDYVLNEHEKKLIRKLAMYESVLGEAVKSLAPHKVANYLYETAQEFSRFYENVKVAGSEFETERKKIVRAYLNVMTHGLGILGISVPEKM